MFLYNDLLQRASNNTPVRVGLIGAGKFGSMFLSQAPGTPGLVVSAIADLNPAQAKQTCIDVDASEVINPDHVDVIVEATGNPAAGLKHARMAIANGIHIVMVNVEADVLAGPLLAREAKQAGIVYSMAYGDQPALTCELVEWAQATGLVAAGKGTKYLPDYHSSTPDSVWEHYGLTSEQANDAGMNSQMFNSFLDGTKSALEMAAIANATGLCVPTEGLAFPAAGMDDLAHVLRPKALGGQLEMSGQVEVVSSVERDGRPVHKDLRWGVSAMYKPFHLIGLELNISILAAALLNKPTGSTQGFQGDVIATAKRDLRAGEILDGEGGFTVWGKLTPATTSLQKGLLPIGLAHGITLRNSVKANHPLYWEDVEFDKTIDAFTIRRQMEALFE